jgi:hypothetical protein
MLNTVKSALQRAMKVISKPAAYLFDRLSETSTWAGIVGAITGAATLEAPYSYMAIGAGVIAALIKEKKGAKS